MSNLEKIYYLLRIKEDEEEAKKDIEILYDNRAVWLSNITNRKNVEEDKKCSNILITLTILDFQKGIENYSITSIREGDVAYQYDNIPQNILQEIKSLKKFKRGD